MKKHTLLLFLFFFHFSNIYGQSVTLEKGKQFEVDVHTETRSPDMADYSTLTFAFKVEGKDGPNTVLECRIVKVVMSSLYAKYPGSNSILNTDSIHTLKLNSSWLLLHLALMHQPLTVTMSPRGQLLSITGVDKALQAAIDKWGLSDAMASQLKANGKSFPETSITGIFTQLPPQTISYKSEWTSDNLNYKVTAINGALLYITSTSIKTGNGQGMSGSGIFNQVTGLMEQWQYATETKFEQEEEGRKIMVPQYAYKQSLRYGERHYTQDTAWISMAIKTSRSFSDALKTNTMFDSVKVHRYFRDNDAKFGNDPYYVVTRLNLMQEIAGSSNYDAYSKMLRNTPTRFLKDEEGHLFNKFVEVSNTSADSAYVISKYLYKTRLFDQLIQESYAQSFLSSDIASLMQDEGFKRYVALQKLSDADVKKVLAEQSEQRRNSVQKANELLLLLHQDKDVLIQQKINPLYLWVNAKKHEQEPNLLNKTAKAFMHMDDASMKAGNGSRYALLTYKLLLGAHATAKANALLLKTIENLERYSADTLNANHYADQNMLAYAWYLKYQAEKPADSVKALQYLSKAARCSPATTKEKAHASYYDRVFLHSKESYREEFIERLFNSGDDTQALKVFVDHVNAGLDNIDELQKLYESHFTNKSFKDFFVSDVISTWKTAPPFTLKALDGKEYSLAAFRNSWLVLEFWGTWCGPCRAEMPQINAFNKELSEGKHSGINFLSIACRDNEQEVKLYITANKFEIPAAMANDTIEKQYSVSSYPSKIIISPEGKMLTLKFGGDWTGIIKKLNQMYPANN
ncbi:DUF6263 family protein [Mucilaginibacter sp. P19]|uniref:Thiol-disulfide isomerase or thioredoxin n=1 Tax=Mucilaginibacter gossypii TaxID=551996 RepID=A0A1G7W6B5_9SPHI|nr:DUF6263 family protein [Mucilaginibacter gossypii]SDG67496.1 Thiol-disulfide isomerase or thioredoxin [Mucilaginibacter gossypii]